MKSVLDLLEEITKNDYSINTFNIFIKDKDYIQKFEELIEKIKQVDEFDKINNIFPNIDKSMIRYIKTYSTKKEEVFKNIVLFNSDLYKNIEETESYNKNITYKIKNENQNTKGLCTYISQQKTFISDFIDKQSKKVIVSIPMLRSEMFNKESINIDLKTTQKEFDTKVYKQGKKNYLLKKERFIDFTINKEQLLTNIRFVLPNVFIICLQDQSYLYQNKIMISDKLTLNNIKFNNIVDKFIFIKKLHEDVFGIKLTDENISVNLSAKRTNKEGLIPNPFLFNLDTHMIVTKNYISFKYVTSYEDFLEKEKIIKNCIKKQNHLITFLKTVDRNSLLFFNDKKIDLIFSNAFNC